MAKVKGSRDAPGAIWNPHNRNERDFTDRRYRVALRAAGGRFDAPPLMDDGSFSDMEAAMPPSDPQPKLLRGRTSRVKTPRRTKG